MKIDASLAPAGSPGLETAKRASRPQSPVTEGGGEVQLSLSGRLHSSLEADGAGQVDSNRVAAIKQAIAEGRFSINAGAIADRLISSAQELLAKQAKTGLAPQGLNAYAGCYSLPTGSFGRGVRANGVIRRPAAEGTGSHKGRGYPSDGTHHCGKDDLGSRPQPSER